MEFMDDNGWQPLASLEEPSSPALSSRTSLTEPAYNEQPPLRQRRTSIIACERCRRRKIRCSGQQPCATCARFGVRCAKPEFANRERSNSSNAEHAALVDRVRILEARLAAVNYGEQSPIDPSVAFDGRPPLRINTDWAMSTANDQMQQIAHGYSDGRSLSVPTIQITGPNDASLPSSPLAASPAPSLYSGTSRCTTPDSYVATTCAIPWNLDHSNVSMSPNQTQISPKSRWPNALNQHTSLASPESAHNQALVSRRSSTSSFAGLDHNLCALDIENMPFAQEDWSAEGPFDFNDFPASGIYDSPLMPSKEQAETWAEVALQSTDIPLERTALKICIQAIYDCQNIDTSVSSASLAMLSLTSFSLRMAKCVVFLVLCVGIRRSGDINDNMFDCCYSLAHEQMNVASFWGEKGARVIVSLLKGLVEVT